MKNHTLPVKRRPVGKSILKRLSAVTGSRKQRVAATARSADDFESDDQSSKISRALTIIFLIHIVVIGLIFFHQRFLDKDAPKSDTVAKSAAASTPPAREKSLPKLSSGDSIYRVVTGDNYTRIAAAQEVDEADLRAANNNVDIVSGLIMKIPPKRIIAMDPPEVAAIREATPLDRDRGLVEAVPVETAGAPRAQLVKPVPPTPAARETSQVASRPTDAAVSGKTYTVQSGDNIWRIASRFKVDQKALMKINGISDPKKLKLGMKLNIPG